MNSILIKNISNFFFTLFFLILSITSIGQNQNDPSKFLPNITPPSPEAFKFSLYGNTPVGLFTGTPNIQLPLFTYKTANLNVPFSLNYSSSGIKVDDVNSKTGLGWNFIGGGIITRIVRNLEDDYYDDFPLKHLDIASMDKSSVMQNVYFNLFGENNGKDSEKDLFIFNFLNYSGKFFFDDNNKITFLEKSDLKVDLVVPTIGGDIYTFVITTPDGVKYYFQQTEQTMLNTYGGGHAPPSIKTTAWYLNKIVHPKGDEIYFTYSDLTQSYVQSESQQGSRAFPVWQTCGPGQGYARGFTLGPIYQHNTRVIGKTIKSITSNNVTFGSVDFTYEDKFPATSDEPDNVIKTITVKDKNEAVIEKIDFDYLVTTNKRIFLNSFHFLEDTNKYSFSYITPTIFPARLSKSQDHWGYFNGADNSTLLPKINDYGFNYITYTSANREIDTDKSKIGLLNRIVYPTKGYTDFAYESNDYYGKKTILPALTSQSVHLENTIDERRKETTTSINAKFDYSVKFTGGAVFGNCDEGDNTGAFHYKANVSVFCVEDNADVDIYQYSDAYGSSVSFHTTNLELLGASNGPFYFDVKQDKTYIVKLYNDYNCTHSFINLEYYAGESQDLYTNILTGGCRISSTKDYSSSDANPIIKKYYYAKFDQLGTSSGDVLQQPYYVNFSEHLDYDVNGNGCPVTDVVLNSSSVSSMFEMGSNIFYRYVTVSSGDGFENGYEENEFTVNKDYWEHIYLGTREFRNVPWSNLGWNNGKLLKTKIFEKRNNVYIIRKEVTNSYFKDTNNPTFVNFAIYNSAPGTFTVNTQDQCMCTSSNTNEYYPVKYCSAGHFHQKDASGNCIAAGAINNNYNIQHPCFGKINVTIGIPTINHMDIMPYKYISYFIYLGNTVTIDYDKNGENPVSTITNYNYNSLKHFQLTSQTTTNSKGEILDNKYFYAKDSEMYSKPFVPELIASNMIATPLSTQSYKGGTKLSEQLTIYDKSASTNNLLLPKSIYAAKFPNILPEVPTIGNLEKKITFDQYDDKGNVVQYTQESSIPVTIIWGYNKTQPIAKIENATYSEISSSVSNLQNISDTGTETNLIAALTTLRNSLPNAMVTTYTYLPLIGVSTITDPKGSITTYQYDSFNRLKLVKDTTGKIISENQYHYKN